MLYMYIPGKNNGKKMKGKEFSPSEALLLMKERMFSFSLVKTMEVGKLGILAFQHLAKKVKGIGNWELFGGRQSIGSATVLSPEKNACTCADVCTHTQLCQTISGSFSLK